MSDATGVVINGETALESMMRSLVRASVPLRDTPRWGHSPLEDAYPEIDLAESLRTFSQDVESSYGAVVASRGHGLALARLGIAGRIVRSHEERIGDRIIRVIDEFDTATVALLPSEGGDDVRDQSVTGE